jgi:DNA polymerase I-like protein with 3'-5' exonuclease and polymerase domains
VSDNYYHIIQPAKNEPRKVDILLNKPSVAELESWWPGDKTLALDFESRGNDPTAEDFAVVGMGVASESKVLYIHLKDISSDAELWIKDKLRQHDLIAFNVAFDGAAALRWTGRWLGWVGCTYSLFRLLATEGYPDQRWNLETAEMRVLGWPASNKSAMEDWLVANGHVNTMKKPDKSALHLAPFEVIGPYCAADADACWQLWSGPFDLALKQFPGLREYASRFSMCLIKLVCEQQVTGIAIDTAKLQTYHESLKCDIAVTATKWMELPEIKPCIAEYNTNVLDTHLKKEPSKFRKDGKPSKNWEKWSQNRDEICASNHFNLNSDVQLRWLLYEKLGMPVTLKTDSGKASVSGKVLDQFGDIGKLLVHYNELSKEEGFVKGCLELVRPDQTLHIPLKIHGTLTGRNSGSGGLNLQNIPTSQGYMSCWIARPEHVWVKADFSALEPNVLAELSEDVTLMKIYGPNAKPNDVYLFLAANLKQTRDKVRKFYNPELPTAESIKAAKENCREERQLAKVLQLSMSYGAGPRKIQETLGLSGIDMPFQDVQDMYYSYWRLYKGVQEYGDRLLAEWNERKGFVYNGIGRPLAVDYNMTKDLVNRVVQSTGHDILMGMIYFVDQLRLQSKLSFKFVISDYHDEFIVECREEIQDQVKQLIEKALTLTNEWLGGIIKLKVDCKICRTLWEAKS